MRTLILVLIASLIIAPRFLWAQVEKSLALYYDFEGNGDTLVDKSGNKNDGTLFGPKRVNEGKEGKGLLLDGADDYASLPSDSLIPSEGTVAVWVNPKTIPGGTKGYVFSHPYADPPDRIYIFMQNGNLIVGVGGNKNEDTGYSPKADAFIHIVLTWKGGKYEVYVDAELVKSGDYVGLSATHTPSYLGTYDTGSQFLNAILDELKLFTKALSKAEIQKIMMSGTAISVKGKLATTWASIKA